MTFTDLQEIFSERTLHCSTAKCLVREHFTAALPNV